MKVWGFQLQLCGTVQVNSIFRRGFYLNACLQVRLLGGNAISCCLEILSEARMRDAIASGASAAWDSWGKSLLGQRVWPVLVSGDNPTLFSISQLGLRSKKKLLRVAMELNSPPCILSLPELRLFSRLRWLWYYAWRYETKSARSCWGGGLEGKNIFLFLRESKWLKIGVWNIPFPSPL